MLAGCATWNWAVRAPTALLLAYLTVIEREPDVVKRSLAEAAAAE